MKQDHIRDLPLIIDQAGINDDTHESDLVPRMREVMTDAEWDHYREEFLLSGAIMALVEAAGAEAAVEEGRP